MKSIMRWSNFVITCSLHMFVIACKWLVIILRIMVAHEKGFWSIISFI